MKLSKYNPKITDDTWIYKKHKTKFFYNWNIKEQTVANFDTNIATKEDIEKIKNTNYKI